MSKKATYISKDFYLELLSIKENVETLNDFTQNIEKYIAEERIKEAGK
jgi:hypothetical protein